MTSSFFKIYVTKKFPNLISILLLILTHTAYAGTVGWFYALDGDKAAFEEKVGTPSRTVTLTGGTVMYEYRIGPHKVVAAKMGSGCVATAITVSRVMAINPVDRVISTGPAGGIGGGVKPGEWLRVDAVAAWQVGRVGEGGRTYPTEQAEIKIDGISNDWPAGRWNSMPVVRMVSGEAFIASEEKGAELAEDFEAHVVEMNAFGLLTALQGTSAKILILRVVSDLANERASEDFSEFLETYRGDGGTMVAELIKSLPVGKDEPAAHDALRKLLED
jgi:adenosylhomocysteine nucleosidase